MKKKKFFYLCKIVFKTYNKKHRKKLITNKQIMIKHIVFFKLKPEFKGADEFKIAKIVAAELESLPHKIEEIAFLEVGIDFSKREDAYDIVLFSQFETNDDLEIYRNHIKHKEAVVRIEKYTISAVLCDYKSLTTIGYVN